MRVLLVQPPFTLPVDVPVVVHMPLGLCLLAAMARRHGHEVAIVDALAEGWRTERRDPHGVTRGLGRTELQRRVANWRPDLVGISVPFTLQWRSAQKVARWVKELDPRIRVVIGGIWPTIRPEEAMECRDVDILLQGEADESFPHLLKVLEGDGQLAEVDGVGYRDGDRVVIHPKRHFIQDLDSVARPAWELLNLDLYWQASRVHGFNLKGTRSFNVITSRGCPAKCVFCNIAPLVGRPFRGRSPEAVVDELEHLVDRHGADHIQFEDDNLTFDLPRAKKMFRLMIERRLGLAWNTPNGIALWRMDRECLDLMRESGCYMLTFALESGDQEVLVRLMKKPLNLEALLPLIPYARGIGLKAGAFFVVGLPGETKKQMQASFDLPYRVDLDWVEYSIATPHWGTELRRMAEAGGYLHDGPRENLYARRGNITTGEFTAEWLEHKILEEHGRYMRYLARHRPRIFLAQGWEVARRDPAFVARYLLRIGRAALPGFTGASQPSATP